MAEREAAQAGEGVVNRLAVSISEATAALNRFSEAAKSFWEGGLSQEDAQDLHDAAEEFLDGMCDGEYEED